MVTACHLIPRDQSLSHALSSSFVSASHVVLSTSAGENILYDVVLQFTFTGMIYLFSSYCLNSYTLRCLQQQAKVQSEPHVLFSAWRLELINMQAE
jgi:hypothetical protein